MMCMDAQVPRMQNAQERLYLHDPGRPLDRLAVSPPPCRQKKTPPERGLVCNQLAQDFMLDGLDLDGRRTFLALLHLELHLLALGQGLETAAQNG